MDINPEQLKNKYEEYAKDLWYDKVIKERLGQESAEIFIDIKQAIEWLKLEIKKHTSISGNYRYYTIENLMEWIDDAFADLVTSATPTFSIKKKFNNNFTIRKSSSKSCRHKVEVQAGSHIYCKDCGRHLGTQVGKTS